MNLSSVFEELIEERGIDRSVLSSIICEGILAAYQKKHPNLLFKVEYNQSTDAPVVFVEKKIVAAPHDEDSEISLRKARNINKDAQEGESMWVLFDEKIGRIEILKARQVIASRIREIEAAAVYNEFKEREGEIVLGTIYKCERSGMIIKIDDYLALLPRSLSLSEDKCIIGYPLRALVKEVLKEPRNDNQIILDRSSDLFLQRLFELEIPEVFERLVEIKKVVRVAGYKSKIIVVSHDKNIDPVGTCVGVGGGRIRPILKELGTEKIDIISAALAKEDLVAAALKPAIVNRVVIEGNSARVWIDDDQRSVAIGKMGQNIALASRLVDMEIQLVSTQKAETLGSRSNLFAPESEIFNDSDHVVSSETFADEE